MKLFLLPLLAFSLVAAEDKPSPELDAAKQRIAWLEQKLAATEQKAKACFDIYGADMRLIQLEKQEPKMPTEKELPLQK
jgi:hypothetical protein